MFILLIAGCKTTQPVTVAPNTPEQIDKKENTTTKLTSPKVTHLDYQWISYRAQFSLKDYTSKKETLSASAFFVNRKDSIIYITASMLGIEGMRVVLTPDSVKFLNHIQNSYYVGDYSFLNKMLGFTVDFQMMQSIFLGEDISGFEGKFTHAIQNDTNIYTCSSRKNSRANLTIAQTLKTNKDHKVIENSLEELSTRTSIAIKYGNFLPLGNQSFFQQAEIAVPKENMLLELKIKDTKLNVPGPTSIRIPAKYKPIQ